MDKMPMTSSLRVVGPSLLPIECIEEIVVRLPPKNRFIVATDFRLLFIQSRCLPLDNAGLVTIDTASTYGMIDFLDAWKRSGLVMHYSCVAMDGASRQGHVHVLEWWKRATDTSDTLELKYTDCAMDFASCHGHIDVLEWWKNSGLELKYSIYAMNSVYYARHTRIDILEWWKRASEPYVGPNGVLNNGLECRYSEYAMDMASQCGDMIALDWWKESGLELKYSNHAIDAASSRGFVHVLEWWKNSGLELRYSIHAMNSAIRRGHTAVVDWWKKSGLELKFCDMISAERPCTHFHV